MATQRISNEELAIIENRAHAKLAAAKFSQLLAEHQSDAVQLCGDILQLVTALKYEYARGKTGRFVCSFCGKGFMTQELRKDHESWCCARTADRYV